MDQPVVAMLLYQLRQRHPKTGCFLFKNVVGLHVVALHWDHRQKASLGTASNGHANAKPADQFLTNWLPESKRASAISDFSLQSDYFDKYSSFQGWMLFSQGQKPTMARIASTHEAHPRRLLGDIAFHAFFVEWVSLLFLVLQIDFIHKSQLWRLSTVYVWTPPHHRQLLGHMWVPLTTTICFKPATLAIPHLANFTEVFLFHILSQCSVVAIWQEWPHGYAMASMDSKA